MAFLLQVADEGFDGGSAAELALDGAEDAAFLAGDEDAPRLRCVMSTVSLVDVDPLDLSAGEPLCILNDVAQSVAIVGMPGRAAYGARTGRRVSRRWW